jgi:hypothetical protein
MASAAHLGKQVKPKMAVTAFDPEQKRVMPIVLVRQRLKSVKIHLVPTHYPAKSGNVAAPSR